MKKREKVVLVGPVYPFKGGISHYTGLMYRALSKKYDVDMISYKMQYPKILFKKEQRDYSNDMFKIEDTDFYINTANPVNWIATASHIRKKKPDLVILQWWHPYFAPCYWSIGSLLGKCKVLFICHNVFPHERFPLDRFLTKMVMAKGDYYIVHSKQDEEDLKTIRKNAKYKRTVLPTFNAFKIQNLDKTEGRRQLGIAEEEKVLLFFGFVRGYKGLKHLIRAMQRIVNNVEQAKLLIVGDFAGDKEEYLKLIEEYGVKDYIEIHDGYIPDQEVEKFFAASDVVVLPYESATQSGIVQIAYGFEKPVIATKVGGLPEVVLDGKTGYIVPPKDSEKLAERITDYFEKNKEMEFQENIQKEAYKYSWEHMTEIISELKEQ